MSDERIIVQSTEEASARTARARRTRDALLACIIVAGLALSAVISHRLEQSRPPAAARYDADALYISPEAARRMSLSFNGLVADWYWMRALQYVGRRIVAHKGDLHLDDLSPLGLKHLGALLDQSTTLDPNFMAAYEFGAVVLPAVDEESALRLIEKGIRDDPSRWRLYYHLGYIHWRRGRFREASDAYLAGSRVAGAPEWMRVMAAQMELGGGSRETARTIYTRMRDETDDDNVKQLAELRIAQVDSFDERDRIRQVLSEFRARAGRCPKEWREAANALRAAGLRIDKTGAPTDPAGAPYVLDATACEGRLNPLSPIPKK